MSVTPAGDDFKVGTHKIGTGQWPATGDDVQVMEDLKGTKAFSRITSATTPAAANIWQVLAANAARKSCTIFNNSGHTVYLSNSSTVDNTYFPLLGQTPISDGDSNDAWYAYDPTGNPDLRIIEVSKPS